MSAGGVTVDYDTADVASANDYYPGGMLEPGRQFIAANNNHYRYGYQNQETDSDICPGAVVFDLRIEDPRIVRFLSVDPLEKEYAWNTPYAVQENKFGLGKELEGAEDFILGTTNVPFENVVTDEGGDVITSGSSSSSSTSTSTSTDEASTPSDYNVAPGGGGNWQQIGTQTSGKPFTDWSTPAPWPGYIPYQPQLKNPQADQTSTTQQPQLQPQPKPQPQKQLDPTDPKQQEKAGGYFWVTYTKTKINSDGTTTTYSGRTSGWYSGNAPTLADARNAVARRNSGHAVLNEEGYEPAQVDQYSTNKIAIRGREQDLVDYHGGAQSEGGHSRNKIRAVARGKAAFYQGVSQATYGALPNNNPADKKHP